MSLIFLLTIPMPLLSPWHEPNMVHVRLLFLQPGLCDVHSCSLLFVGALDELQHFIWNLGWIEWDNLKCKAPRVIIFGPTMLNCIEPESVCYKSILPYGNLRDVYHGLCFHWKTRWLEAVSLALGHLPSIYQSGFCQGLAIHLGIKS